MSNNNEKEGLSPQDWIYLIIGIIYGISPVDIIPDVVPFAGWVDDVTITGSAILNAIEAYNPNNFLGSIAKSIKWIVIILGVIATAIVGLLVYFVWNAVAS